MWGEGSGCPGRGRPSRLHLSEEDPGAPPRDRAFPGRGEEAGTPRSSLSPAHQAQAALRISRLPLAPCALARSAGRSVSDGSVPAGRASARYPVPGAAPDAAALPQDGRPLAGVKGLSVALGSVVRGSGRGPARWRRGGLPCPGPRPSNGDPWVEEEGRVAREDLGHLLQLGTLIAS